MKSLYQSLFLLTMTLLSASVSYCQGQDPIIAGIERASKRESLYTPAVKLFCSLSGGYETCVECCLTVYEDCMDTGHSVGVCEQAYADCHNQFC